FSIANPSGSMILWQLAQAGLTRCCSICWRTVSIFPSALFVSSKDGTLGGGGGGGVPRRFSSSHFPRIVGAVLVAYDVPIRMLPCPNKPFRFSSVIVTRRKCEPVTFGMP